MPESLSVQKRSRSEMRGRAPRKFSPLSKLPKIEEIKPESTDPPLWILEEKVKIEKRKLGELSKKRRLFMTQMVKDMHS